MNPAKRGQLCVVRTLHTITPVSGPATVYDEYAIAIVAGIDKVGTIKKVHFPKTKSVVEITKLTGHKFVYVTPIVASSARNAWDLGPFETFEAARAALLPFLSTVKK